MSYRQDPRNQYYNNGTGNQSGSYAGGYQQGQLYSNPRTQNDGYRPPIRNPYPTPNPNIKGPPRGRTSDDDDNASIGSSVYSQPSVAGFSPPNNMRYYQEQSLETTEPRRQSLLYNEYDYTHPPSPFAASTNTHNSTTGLTAGSSQQGLPLIDQNENNYMMDNMEENYSQDTQPNYFQDQSQDTQPNYYQDNSQDTQPIYFQDHSQDTQPNYYQDHSQDTQPQFNVYNDFNNNFQSDEKNDEESRNNTLTGPDGSHDPNSYAMNDDRSGNGKGARQSMSGDHYVVKKERRCAFCSRKTCVIITFTILVLLAAGMYFVWPRIPKVNPLLTPPPTPVGDAEITINPPLVKMQMDFQLELDNRENWLPYKFNSFNIDVLDVGSLKSIGSGDKKGFLISGRAKTTISIPIKINYAGQNDGTLQTFIDACTQPQQHSLKLRFETKMLIMGLDWVKKPTVTIPVLDFPCPFNVTRPSDGQPTPAPEPTTAPPVDQPDTPAPAPVPAPAPRPAPAPAPGQPPAGQPPAPAAGQPPTAAPAPAPAAGQPPTAAPAPAPAPAAGQPGQPPAAAPAPAPAAGQPAGQPPAAAPAAGQPAGQPPAPAPAAGQPAPAPVPVPAPAPP